MHDYWLRADRNLSVSSHLTPDPEKRLSRMTDILCRQQDSAEKKLAVLAIVAAIEMFAVYPSHTGTEALLSIAIIAAFTGLSPLMDTEKEIRLLDHNDGRVPDDYILDEYDIAKYSRSELVNFLDKYLGGGISATPYYEDMVSRILNKARRLVRRHRMFMICLVLMALAQIAACVSFFL